MEQNIFGPKFCRPKYFLDPNIFSDPKIFLGPKFSLLVILLDPIQVGSSSHVQFELRLAYQCETYPPTPSGQEYLNNLYTTLEVDVCYGSII